MIDHYRAQLARLLPSLPGNGRAAWLGLARQAAMERFAALGFPTTRDEEWRFTSVAPIAQTPFEVDGNEPSAPVDAAVEALRLDGTAELVFVNGRFAPALSRAEGLVSGARAGSLARALDDDSGWAKPEWLETALTRIAGDERHAFLQLNTALFRDGGFVYVPRGLSLAAPVHLLFLSVPDALPRASHLRNLVVLEGLAQATVVETHAALGEGRYFTNTVTEIALAEGAVLDYHRLQAESELAYHVSTVAVRQDRDSRLTSHSFDLGGALVRNDVSVLQAAAGTDSSLDGLYALRADQHVDNHTTLDHAHPHGTSRELYKGVLAGHAHGVFNGKVLVRLNAAKTDARQTNKNLLLSRDAVIDTKPQLEILTDDVKCAHGATIGQLSDDALFYLRSRGLGLEESRSLLTYAFASEVIQRVALPGLRQRLQDRMLDRLPGGETLKEIV